MSSLTKSPVPSTLSVEYPSIPVEIRFLWSKLLYFFLLMKHDLGASDQRDLIKPLYFVVQTEWYHSNISLHCTPV